MKTESNEWNEIEDGSRFWICDDPPDHPNKLGVVDEVAGGIVEMVDTWDEADAVVTRLRAGR